MRRIFMDEEIGEIEMLADFDDALLGCVYAEDGTPVACYSSEVVMMRLAEEGYGEDEALDYVEEITTGMKLIWIHPIEFEPSFTPTKGGHLRLVH
jgi:hypothetical protein